MSTRGNRQSWSMKLPLTLVLCLIWSGALQAQCNPEEVAKLVPPDGAIRDHFGVSVSISGDGTRAIVGVLSDDDQGRNSGSAYVFRNNGSDWIKETKLLPSDGSERQWFGNPVAISSDGNAVIITRSGDESAYIFRYDGSEWIEEAKLLASDGVFADLFGNSISINGDGTTVIIGAPFDDDNGSESGSAYVFRFSGSEWKEEAKLLPTDGAEDNEFGGRVSISDDGAVVIVGARRDDDVGVDSGSAYLFHFNGSEWIEEAKLIASDAAFGDFFGVSVSLSGDGTAAIVGAYGNDDGGNNAGSAYVFRFNGSEWSEEAKLLPADGAENHLFGADVSMSVDGNVTIVGSPLDNDNGRFSGSAYVFRLHGTRWLEEAKFVASDGAAGDEFGNSIKISNDGTTAVIGAIYEDSNGSDSGSAYVYRLNCSEPCLTLDVAELYFHLNAEFTVTNGTPGARAAILWGLGGDPTRLVNLDGWCATFGFDIELSRDRIRLVATGLFDADGRFSAKRYVLLKPRTTVYFQSAEQGTCPNECMSNEVRRIVR